jgi:hypothetical protein
MTYSRMSQAEIRSLTADELRLVKSTVRNDDQENGAVFNSSSPPRPLSNNKQTLNILKPKKVGGELQKQQKPKRKSREEAENKEEKAKETAAKQKPSPAGNQPEGKSPRWREEKVLAYDESQPDNEEAEEENGAEGFNEEGNHSGEKGQEAGEPVRKEPLGAMGSLAKLAGSFFTRRRHNTAENEEEGGAGDEVDSGQGFCPSGTKSGGGVGCQKQTTGGQANPSAPSGSPSGATESTSSSTLVSAANGTAINNSSSSQPKLTNSASAFDPLYKTAGTSGSHQHHPHPGSCNRFFYQYNGYCCCGCKMRSSGGCGSDQSECSAPHPIGA